MTERLKQLLGAEAQDLEVPAPTTDAVLRQGRDLRRRNRIAVGAAGLAAAVVVGGTVLALAGGDTESAAPDPATTVTGGNAVFSHGNQVFYDGPSKRAAIQDKAVKSLFYTSAGVLVRHGDNSGSDGGGPQRFSLVTPDGDVERLGLETEDSVHASDVDQPYVAYGEAVDGKLQAVVYDVAADAEAARVTVGPTENNWFPVSLDGDMVYVEDGAERYEVDWQNGTVAESDVPSVWGVTAGRVATQVDGGFPSVVDAETGETLLFVETPGTFELSPDGRYAALQPAEEAVGAEAGVETDVYDIDSGEAVTVSGDPYGWGWTADGDLFQVEKSQVRTCDTATGECTTEPYSPLSVPEPDPVTVTMKDPMCPDGGLECHTDPEFYENCFENPDQCEWRESQYVEEPTVELRLGGRIYES